MKYGLIVYKDTENIGDDVQSYVASKYLPRVDYIIDRDDVTSFIPKKKEYVATIMNAWWMNKKFNWPPSPYIYPKMISMHFTHYDTIYHIDQKHITTGYGKKYLKKYEPIGCRNSYTKKILQDNGINSYFSGCMTLTLDRFENIEKEDYILLVDVTDAIYEKIKTMTNKRIERITNNRDSKEYSKLDWETRRKYVEDYLKTIQKASIVITPRLHCALPSLALQTPVLLIDYSLNNDRTSDFLSLLYTVTEEEFLKEKTNYDINNPKDNKKDYLKIRKKLEKECYDFINEIEKSEEKIKEELPDIEQYSEFVERNNFQKGLLLESFHNINDLYLKEIKNSQTAWASSNTAWAKCEELSKELAEKIDDKIDRKNKEKKKWIR